LLRTEIRADTQIHRSPAETISRGGSSHPGSTWRPADALALQALHGGCATASVGFRRRLVSQSKTVQADREKENRNGKDRHYHKHLARWSGPGPRRQGGLQVGWLV